MARLNAAGQASAAISTAKARSVVPPGLVTAAAAGGVLGARSQQRARSGHGLSRKQPCQIGGNALLARRLLHQFRQQEHIRRPAARHRRDRIEQAFILDPGHHADRLQQPLAQDALRRIDAKTRARDRDALPNRRRRVRHRPHDRRLIAEQPGCRRSSDLP